MKQKFVALLTSCILTCVVCTGTFSQTATDPRAGVTPPAVNSPGSSRFPNEELIRASSIDATLHSIAVVTEDRLCAVGDRGAILFTEDSGHSWEILSSPTSCNLYAVTFEGALGFAVGGWIGNVTNTSHGVVLRSTDGGKNWETTAALQLSRLTGAQLLGGRLIAWGDYSPELSSSVFESTDGGLSWHAITSEIGHAAAVGVSSGGGIAAVDTLGRAMFSQSPMVKSVPTTSRLRSLRQTGTQQWLACGENGECIVSRDGQAWHEVPMPLSPQARAVMSFTAIATVPSSLADQPYSGPAASQELWMGGSPGSILLHSNDAGTSWRVAPTGQPLPIHGLAFLDPKRGWAVGAQGLVLATRDGGQSWYAQRKHAERVGVLAAVSRHTEIPWCPLVACAWDKQVGAVAIVTDDEEMIGRANFTPSQPTQLSDLAPQVGMAELRTWESANETTALREQRLAIDLLAWRPDVVLSNEPSSTELYSDHQDAVSVAAAVALAADAQNTMPIVKELGLSNWQVTKFAAVTNTQGGQYSEQSRRVLRSPGLAIWDILLPLPPDVRERSESVALRTIWSRSQAEVVHRSLFGGCAKSAANARTVSVGTHGNYQLVMGRAHRQNSLNGLAEQPQNEALEKWSTELNFVLDTFPASEAAPALVALSEKLSQTLNWERQRTVLETLAVRGVGTDAADWAKIKLLQYTSSDEFAAWRTRDAAKLDEDPETVLASMAVGFATNMLLKQATWNTSPFESEAEPSSAVVTASATTAMRPAAVGPKLAHNEWMMLFNRACQMSPKLRARADMKALFAKQMRVSGDSLNQTEALQTLGTSNELIGWNQIARQELLVAASQHERLKWRATAARAATPPVLDGRLDEPFWQSSKVNQLSSLRDAAETQTTTLAWAYDDSFLYFGITASRDPTRPLVPRVVTRDYDASLDKLDHVEIVFDTDRDYNTTIELAVAENGQTYDRCCGISSYNPKWHVLVHPEQDRWTAEVAVRLSDLTTAESLANETWALSLRRLVPGREPQSWSQLRTHRPLLQAAGILHFSTGAATALEPTSD